MSPEPAADGADPKPGPSADNGPSRRGLLGRGLLGLGAALGSGAVLGPVLNPVEAADPEPDTSPGERVLEATLPGLKVGAARYREGPTGVTVLSFGRRVRACMDRRGGNPVTLFTDGMERGARPLDALVFTGGSALGLEAVTGVTRALFEQGGSKIGWSELPLVAGAVIYDFGLRNTSLTPDARLGRAALKAARAGRIPLGARGAGAGATVGKWLNRTTQPETAGQGAALRTLGETRILVLTVVNALGAIEDRDGRVIRGHRDPKTGARIPMPKTLGAELAKPKGGNTTLTAVIVNERLSAGELALLARQTHSAMARVIRPFHTAGDGDVLFAITTDAVRSKRNVDQLAFEASEAAIDAVLASIAGE